MNKVGMISLGCAKNLTDTEGMLGILNSKGYEIEIVEDLADIIIVNTCCFIESAKQESIDVILEMAKHKTTGNLKLLIVAGCMSQRYKEELIEEIPEVDAVMGTGEYQKIVEIIEKAAKGKVVSISEAGEAPLEFEHRMVSTPPYTAYLKIAEGCDNHCTYCVIPSVRGKFRSRTIENIVDEAEKLVSDGAKELILIAQNTTSYGKDIYGERCLEKLMHKLSKLEGLEWIRVHYLYPEEITSVLLDEMVSNPKICKYFDIPIQHSSDKILKLMGRKTTSAEIKKLISTIRSKAKDAVIRTSFIVGFPYEDEYDFKNLKEFIKEIQFDRMGVFEYSKEEDTPAFSMNNQVEDNVKQSRREEIMDLQYEIVQQIGQSKVGNVIKVLIEGYDPIIKMSYGRSEGDSLEVDPKIFISTDQKTTPGDFIFAKIISAFEYDLIAEHIK